MNIRNSIYSVVLIMVLLLLSYPHLKKAALVKENMNALRMSLPEINDKKKEGVREKKPAGRIGERIVYDVKLAKVNLGKAVFTHLSPARLNEKQVNRMNFETKLARFNDLEIIYSDPDTCLPLKVERDISNWPFSEKISEHYDQEKFMLTILKNGKTSQTVIKKDAPIHNAVMLPFYVRGIARLDPGWSMAINLPNQKFRITLAGTENIGLNGQSFKAYRFESDPKKFEIWVSADEQRIPLKIKGTGALGYTLIMKEYFPPPRHNELAEEDILHPELAARE